MLSSQTHIISDPLVATYAFIFDWVRLSHVVPVLNGVDVPSNDYSFASNSVVGAATVVLSGSTLSGLSVNDILTIEKRTPVGFSERTVDFSQDSTVTEESLDDAILHNLSAIQDLNDLVVSPGIAIYKFTAGGSLAANTTTHGSGAYISDAANALPITASSGWTPYGSLGFTTASTAVTLPTGTYRVRASVRLYNALAAANNIAVGLYDITGAATLTEIRTAADRVAGEGTTTFEQTVVFVNSADREISVRAVALTGADIRLAGGTLEVERLDV